MLEDLSYPMMVSLRRLPCAVVGGGSVAARKARAFLDAGARVRLIAPDMSDEAAALLARDGFVCVRARYGGVCDLADARVVAAATGDLDVDRRVASDAEEIGALFNCASLPELSNFIVPASFADGPLSVAVSCAGMPAFSRLVRGYIGRTVGRACADFARYLKGVRASVRIALPTPDERGDFWRRVLTDDIMEMLASGRVDEAKEVIGDAARGVGAQP